MHTGWEEELHHFDNDNNSLVQLSFPHIAEE